MNIAELLKTMRTQYAVHIERVSRSSARVITYSAVCAGHMIFVTIARYDNARFIELRIVELCHYTTIYRETIKA